LRQQPAVAEAGNFTSGDVLPGQQRRRRHERNVIRALSGDSGRRKLDALVLVMPAKLPPDRINPVQASSGAREIGQGVDRTGRTYGKLGLSEADLKAATAPFVRTAFRAAACRLAPPRCRALLCAWRESARWDAAAVPSPSKARSAARDRLGFGLRPVARGAFCPGGSGSFTPARLAFDSPMAITCLAERAPCLPSRTCSISSRTYSPACVDGDLAFRARRVVFVFGTATVHRRRVA
jgi:hypothetical protein